jgi:formate hydrogenlyase transcriptional activator
MTTNERKQAEVLRRELAADRDRLRVLLEVSTAVSTEITLDRLIRAIAAVLGPIVPSKWVNLALYDAEKQCLRLHALVHPDGTAMPFAEGREVDIEREPPGQAFLTRKPYVRNTVSECLAAVAHHPPSIAVAQKFGVPAFCFVPLFSRGEVIGTLNFVGKEEHAFDERTVDFLVQIANHIGPAVDNSLAYDRLRAIKEQLAKEKVYLEDEIREGCLLEEIIGRSPPLKRVLADVETVATTDSTVLIQGETGTGKELVARAIHERSARKDNTFVKLNCAAIPTGLLESELFGHEKGAFTGAVAQKPGRFELAHKGTLFLDEIGEVAPELQPKLLRVLQDQEFERLGGTKTIKTDVRVVAATNRDLSQMVTSRQFRSDLFYRLNVFPIAVPPLRERKGDVPLLVKHFVDQLSRRMGKRIESIPNDAMEALERYHWPGNVRELENFLERSVILTKGPALQVSIQELAQGGASSAQSASPVSTAIPEGVSVYSIVEKTERDVLLRALEECGWRVGGPKGAALRLGIGRTTLQSKMARLGIARRSGASEP